MLEISGRLIVNRLIEKSNRLQARLVKLMLMDTLELHNLQKDRVPHN